jgi:hypothetical protein
MMSISRTTMLAVGALFSAYHIVVGSFALPTDATPWPSIVAMVLYGVATVMSLWPLSPTRMSPLLAAFNVGVSLAACLLVTSRLDPESTTGYETWHVAAVGTLMTITAVRRQFVFGWVGVGFVTLQSIAWGGLEKAIDMGVVGSIVWVSLANLAAYALSKAARDARQFAVAEREAVAWQAGQEAHLYERQIRLTQTSKTAEAMLQRIALTGGSISEEDRAECFVLEGALRDEIRGRQLLDDGVRQQIMAARRRGAIVQLFDEGGVDDLEHEELHRVLGAVADALAGSNADRLIIRTKPADSDVAVTVVGLRTVDGGSASALSDDHDDEVDVWLEIPRASEPALS